MSSDDCTAPVYGPPKRNNYAEWKRECANERPISATVQASKDRFQRALLGCHLPAAESNVDGAVAASLTFREQKPPKPPFRCPDRFATLLLSVHSFTHSFIHSFIQSFMVDILYDVWRQLIAVPFVRHLQDFLSTTPSSFAVYASNIGA